MLDDRPYMREPDWRPKVAQGGVSLCLKLIIINIILYVLQRSVEGFTESLALNPSRLIQGHVWELLTFQFLHDDRPGHMIHIIVNCAMIWFMGRQMEDYLGKKKFLSLYLLAGVFGGLLQCMLAWTTLIDPDYLVGASAGILGLMAAFAVIYWNRELNLLILFVIPVRMNGKFILIGLIVIEGLLWTLLDTRIAHGAHLGGMLGGGVFILLFVQGGTMSGAPPLWNRVRERSSSGKSGRGKVETMDGGASAYSKSNGSINEPEEDLMKDKIDPILDKISAHGFGSLSDEERDILEKARKKMMR